MTYQDTFHIYMSGSTHLQHDSWVDSSDHGADKLYDLMHIALDGGVDYRLNFKTLIF